MAHNLAVELECPECGALLTKDKSNCSECGIEIDWSPGDESNKEDVEDMLDDILSRSGSKRAMGIESEESEDGPDDGPQGLTDAEAKEAGTQLAGDEAGSVEHASEDAKTPEDLGSLESGSGDELADEGKGGYGSVGEEEQEDDLEILENEEYEEAESEQESITDEIDDIESPPPRVRRLYAKTFSTLGIITTALAFLSLGGLIILLNWDAWVKGDANGSIGDTQWMAIYAAVTITILLFAISAGDTYRIRNDARG